MFDTAQEKFCEPLGRHGERIKICSPSIYKSKGEEKISQIINCCSPLTGIQLIVGHHPKIPRVVQNYMKQDFNLIGDEKFLYSTSMGGGYWINTNKREKISEYSC